MRVSAAELRKVTEDSLVAAGYPADEIPQIVEVLTYAQWRGNWQSLVQLSFAGFPRFQATGQIHIERETAVSALLHGELHPGIAVMCRATEVAERKAKVSGVAIVGAHHSAPPGTAAVGYYVEKLGAAGLVAFGWSGSSELVAPYGGAEACFGTNPLAVAFPSANEPLVIDLATSAIPAFELARQRLFGGTLPPGAALDDQGHDTDDPRLAKALKTFADSPKSSALALMVEVLTGPLVKASFTGVGDTRGNWGTSSWPSIPRSSWVGTSSRPRSIGSSRVSAPPVLVPDLRPSGSRASRHGRGPAKSRTVAIWKSTTSSGSGCAIRSANTDRSDTTEQVHRPIPAMVVQPVASVV